MDNAKSRFSKNGNARGVQGRAISQIGGTNKMEEIYRVISKTMPKSTKGKQVIDRNEFVEEWSMCLAEWDNNRGRNLGNPVDDYDIADNHGIEESNKRLIL